MFGKQRSDWLEDVCEGHKVFVEQAAPLHYVQASGQTHQPAEKNIKLDEHLIFIFANGPQPPYS